MEKNERCQTCCIVKDSKVTEEKYPLEKLEINVFYCPICGFLYTYDEFDDLNALVNIKKKILNPKLRSVIFGLDTRLIGSVNRILDKTRQEENL